MLQNLKNKKVVVMGLGTREKGSGVSGALFFARRGAKVLVTDLKGGRELEKQAEKLRGFAAAGNVEFVLGRHRKGDFKEADFVFKNPGVPKNSPYLKTARENKIPIINDWTIFF